MSHSSRRTLAPACLQALLVLALAAGTAAAAPPPGPVPSPLTAQPSSQDFGTVRVEQGEQNASIWVQNNGPDPVQLSAATISGDAALRVSNDGCNGQLLSNGMGCNVGIGFDPDDDVHYAATLHVPVAGFADLDVPLAGTGAAQRMTLEPSALDFGSVAVGDSVVRSFTVTSTGNLSFQSLVAIPSGGDVGPFRVEHDGCSLQQLITGASCDVAVRFTPPAAGAYAATLLLIGGEDQPGIVPLKGAGVAAPAPAAPSRRRRRSPQSRSPTSRSRDPRGCRRRWRADGSTSAPPAAWRSSAARSSCAPASTRSPRAAPASRAGTASRAPARTSCCGTCARPAAVRGSRCPRPCAAGRRCSSPGFARRRPTARASRARSSCRSPRDASELRERAMAALARCEAGGAAERLVLERDEAVAQLVRERLVEREVVLLVRGQAVVAHAQLREVAPARAASASAASRELASRHDAVREADRERLLARRRRGR